MNESNVFGPGVGMTANIPPQVPPMNFGTPAYGAPTMMPNMNTPYYNGIPDLTGSQIYGGQTAYGDQIVNDQTVKINPQVMQLIKPIIETMTEYDMFKRTTPAFGMWDPKNSLDEGKKKAFDLAKKNCVHLIKDIKSGQLVPTLEEVDETRFRCRLCGREVYKKFDKSAVDKLQEAIAVLNMLTFFGMSLNLTAEQVSKIIFLKQCIPEMIQLVDILNKFVSEENNVISSGANVGEASRNAEFHVGNMLGYSSF